MTHTQQTPAVAPQNGVAFMSQAGFLYEAMCTMASYDQQVMRDWIAQQQNSAKAYAGYDANGHLDQNAGVVAAFMNASEEAADASANSIRMDAASSGISAITGGIGLAATIKGPNTSELQAQKDDALALQKELNTGDHGPSLVAKEGLTSENGALQEKINGRIQDWAGDKSKIPNFGGKVDGEVNLGEAFLNKQVANHAKASPENYDKICKNNNERIESFDKQIQQMVTEHNTRTQHWKMATDALSGAAQSGTQAVKANYQSDAGKKTADAEVLKQLQSQVVGNISNAQQQAASFQQAADAIASGFGQITQTRA
jgi:hypothetical protein